MKTKLSIMIMSLALAGTSGAQSINVTTTGVGIGTATPTQKLDVAGNINATGNIAATGDITAGGKLTTTGDIAAGGKLTTTGNVGIGTTTPAVKLDIATNSALRIGQAYLSSAGDFVHLANNEWYDGSIWRTTNTPGALLQLVGQNVIFYTHDGNGGHVAHFGILGNGNVGIGTLTPAHKLDVAGSVRAASFISATKTYADYVFAPDYKLPSLDSVEAHIKEHQHLPGVPSEKEVMADGINLGDMQVKLLAQIEQLTLHMIVLNKKMEAQQEEIKALRAASGGVSASLNLSK